MSTSLYHASATSRDSAAIWATVGAVAKDGFLELSDETVHKVAVLLEDKRLKNGQIVFTYIADNPRDSSYVGDFGPCLLEEGVLAQLREILAEENADAARLLDTVVELSIQTGFTGADYGPAHMKAVNWEADQVEMRLSNGRFDQLLTTLEIPFDREQATGEVDFATFEAAVEQFGLYTGYLLPLSNFIACAKRHNATRVYWA